jgi:hypothetical protein
MSNSVNHARKKRRVWPWVLLGAAIVIFGGFGACAAMVGSVANEIDQEAEREVQVTYSVTGDGTASIQYDTSTDTGISSETANDADLPWTKEVTVSGFFKSPHLIATLGSDGGDITCEIKADGKVVKTASGSGPFASVTCMANLAGE